MNVPDTNREVLRLDEHTTSSFQKKATEQLDRYGLTVVSSPFDQRLMETFCNVMIVYGNLPLEIRLKDKPPETNHLRGYGEGDNGV